MMRRKIFTSLAGAALLAAGASSLAAQDGGVSADKYMDRYTKETFDQADTNQDGFVSWEETKNASFQVERDLAGRKRFDAADLDHDGRLSPMEARTLIDKEVSHKEEAGAAAKKKRVDESDSGSKARSAREKGTNKYVNRYTRDEFDQADTNQDGFVSWEEAKNASSGAERDLFGRERFDAADTDGDGRLSLSEAHTLRQKEISSKDVGAARAKKGKRLKGAGAADTAGAGVSPESRKQAGKRKRYEEASAKRKSENPRVVQKRENMKKRHRAHRPADVND